MKENELIGGYPELSDYLNIGQEEIRRRWSEIPTRAHGNKQQFFKKDVDDWAKRSGFWKFKEPVIKNYKEPLKAVPESKGFGHYGAITMTKDGDGIQCHLCGKFFMHLSGHLHSAHKTNTRDYKEQFDLAYSTPLTSDNYREVLKQKTLEYMRNLTPEELDAYRQRKRESILKHRPGWAHGLHLRLETKNKRGTCPDQLIDMIRKCKESLGKTPSKRDFIVWCGTQRFVHKIYETFGSWSKAVEIAGIEAAPKPEQSRDKKRPWDDEELLEYLKVFYETTGKSPTQTDWYSHDLPDYAAYLRRFGGIVRARELAGVPHPLGNKKKGRTHQYQRPTRQMSTKYQIVGGP